MDPGVRRDDGHEAMTVRGVTTCASVRVHCASTPHGFGWRMASPLRRSLALPHLLFYGVGTIVGAGIYSIIGVAAGDAGGAFWLSFLLAAVAAFLTILSYAELSAMHPRAGAEYQFLRHAIPGRRWPSFLAGWLIALNAAATAATVSLAFVGYLQVFVDTPRLPVAFALLALCTAVNIAGIRESTWMTVTLTSIEAGGLLLVIALGFGQGEFAQHATLPSGSGLSGALTATAVVFFMYVGFEDVANLAEEARDPERTMPRALVLSVVLTSVLYLLVALAVLSVATPESLAESESPLTDAIATTSPWAGRVLGGTALVATTSTALISLVSISRLLFGMAREGDLPAPLARTLGTRKTPWVAALVLFGGACALLPLGAIETIASISACGILLVFICVQLALVVLRLREPDHARPFRVPLAIGRVPLPPLLGAIACAALLTRFEAKVYLVVAGVLAAGLALHLFLGRHGPGRRGTAH